MRVYLPRLFCRMSSGQMIMTAPLCVSAVLWHYQSYNNATVYPLTAKASYDIDIRKYLHIYCTPTTQVNVEPMKLLRRLYERAACLCSASSYSRFVNTSPSPCSAQRRCH